LKRHLRALQMMDKPGVPQARQLSSPEPAPSEVEGAQVLRKDSGKCGESRRDGTGGAGL